VFSEAKDDGSGDDYWSYKSCIAPVKSSPPTNQHPVFYRPDALPVAQPTGKNITSHGCAYPNSPGGLPTLSLTTNSSWLPWGRFAMPLISPLMPVPHAPSTEKDKWKKRLEETQTLRAGCSKVEPKFLASPQPPFPGAWNGQNLISWRWSLPLPTNPVWWGSMHAISSYHGNRHTKTQTNTATNPHTDRTDYNTLCRS